MLRTFLALIAVVLSMNAVADTYPVECPKFYPECSGAIVENLSAKFLEKYPATDWKIVMPVTRVMRMGNGSLKAYWSIAVVPKDSEISTNAMVTDFRAKKPKKDFYSAKDAAAIAAIGHPDFNGEMFDEARFYKAGMTLTPILLREATSKMVAECDKTPECTLYVP